MGDYVSYRYITRLKDNTPNNILDLLEKAYQNCKQENPQDIFEGEYEFLDYLNVLYFDREEKFIVLYGRSKYFGCREPLKKFLEWISPYIYLFDQGEYQGIVYGSDYSFNPPKLIMDSKLIEFDSVQKYHDEQDCLIYGGGSYKRRIRLTPDRSRALEDLLDCVLIFLKYLENNSRKKLRMSTETRNLIKLAYELIEGRENNLGDNPFIHFKPY